MLQKIPAHKIFLSAYFLSFYKTKERKLEEKSFAIRYLFYHYWSGPKAGTWYSAPSPVIFQVPNPLPPSKQTENWWFPPPNGAIHDLHTSGVIWRRHEMGNWGRDRVLPRVKEQWAALGTAKSSLHGERDGWWGSSSPTGYFSFQQENIWTTALRKEMRKERK